MTVFRTVSSEHDSGHTRTACQQRFNDDDNANRNDVGISDKVKDDAAQNRYHVGTDIDDEFVHFFYQNLHDEDADDHWGNHQNC